MKWTFFFKTLFVSLIYSFYICPCFAQFNILPSAEPVLLDQEKYKLTSPRPYQKGAIWHPTPFDLSHPFDMTFQAFLGCQKKGAEGLAFVWQQEGLTAMGSDSTGFACKGISPALAVIIDNHANSPQENFKSTVEQISLVKDGDLNQLVAGPAIANPSKKNDTTAQCKNREIRVFWDPAAPTLKVFVDGKARLVYRSNIVKKIFNNDPIVYWGFTAATGQYYNTHGVWVTQYPNMPEKEEVVVHNMIMAEKSNQNENTVLGTPLDSLPQATAHQEVVYQEITRQNVPPSCFGSADGSIYIKVKGTQQPYRFLWEDGSTLPYRKNLEAGKYAFTIFDKNGNSKTDTARLLNPSTIKLKEIENIPNKADFGWKAKVTGGNPPYSQQRGAILVLGNAEIKHTPTKVDILNANDIIYTYETGGIPKAGILQVNQDQLITEIGFVNITDESGCEVQYYLEPRVIATPTQIAETTNTQEVPSTPITAIPQPTVLENVDTNTITIVQTKMEEPSNPEKKQLPKTVKGKRKASHFPQKAVERLEVSYTTRNIPDSLGERRVKTGKRVLVWAEEIEIMVWDSEEVDGDTISLYFNGDWILKEYPLRRKKKKLKVQVEPNADNYLILYAHNEGRRPPNTAALKISDGKRENKIGLSADMRNCDAVNFKLKK